MACGEYLFPGLLVSKMVSSIYAFVCACTVSLAYSAPILNASSPVVSVKNGSYTGIHNTYYDQDFFLGIPYAQVSPLSKHRKPS